MRGLTGTLSRLAAVALVSSDLLGCAQTTQVDASDREEAAQLLQKIDRLRQAANPEKPALLAQLERASCSAPETCALKGRCSRAYQRLLAALAAIASADDPQGTPNSASAALTRAENDLEVARREMLACSSEQAELRRRYKL